MDQTKIINNFIDESDCQTLISRLEYLISSGEVKAGEDGRIRVINKEDEVFSPIVEKYKNKVLNLFSNEFRSFEGYAITKYIPGVGLIGHKDCEDEQQIGALMYLNDDYEGGELNYQHIHENTTTLKPKAGDMIYLPFWYFHEVNKVISGNRYFFTVGFNKNPE